MEEVLCILTYEAIVILGMKEILESDDRNRKGPVSLPPVKRLIEFEKAGLPTGIGCWKLEDTLYMFGGEFLADVSCPNDRVPFGVGNFGYDVMALDLCDPHSKPTCVGKLKDPKIRPIVFEFKSKIYIFSFTLMDYKDNFEVWDPVTREASSLPPPPTPPFQISRIDGYFLTENGIVLAFDGYEVFFLNLDSQIWEKRPKSVPRNMQDVLRFNGVQAPGHNDVYLRYADEGILSVNLFEPWLYQNFNWTQKYTDLNVEYYVDHDMSHIVDSWEKGQGQEPRYTCALVPCLDYKELKMRIIIDVFRVDKNASHLSTRSKREGLKLVQGEELFSVTSLKKQVYEFNFHKIRGKQILPFVRRAYIWSLPQVSRTSIESIDGANGRNAQESRKA